MRFFFAVQCVSPGDGIVFPDFFPPGDRAPAGHAVDDPARRFGVRFMYFFLVFLFAPFFEFC